jgi:site-specific recombinase XerD
VRIEFCRRRRARQADGNAWREVFEDLIEKADIENFRFHDPRHPFASWYMMNGGDLYELAKILGHSNIKMTERYAKLARQHIARTGSTARGIWKLMELKNAEQANAV